MSDELIENCRVCEHGNLARVCLTCEQAAELSTLRQRAERAEAERDRIANENTLMQRALSLASHDFSSENYEAVRRHLCDMHARVNVENDFVATLKAHAAAHSTIADLTGQMERLREDAARWKHWLNNHGWSGYFDDGATNSESDADIIAACDKERAALGGAP